MSDKKEAGPDRAREIKSRRRTPTARQRKVVEARLADPKASEYQIMLRAGYTPGSARNPGVNLPPGGSFELARRELEQSPDSTAGLKPKSVKLLHQALDEAEKLHPTDKASIAGSTLRLTADMPEEQQSERDDVADQVFLRRYGEAVWRKCLLCVQTYGLEGAAARLTGLRQKTDRKALRIRLAPSGPSYAAYKRD